METYHLHHTHPTVQATPLKQPSIISKPQLSKLINTLLDSHHCSMKGYKMELLSQVSPSRRCLRSVHPPTTTADSETRLSRPLMMMFSPRVNSVYLWLITPAQLAHKHVSKDAWTEERRRHIFLEFSKYHPSPSHHHHPPPSPPRWLGVYTFFSASAQQWGWYFLQKPEEKKKSNIPEVHAQ